MALLFLLSVSAFAAEPPLVQAGSELDFRPYCFTDAKGQPTGFGPDLLRAVAEKMGLRLQITPGPWDSQWNKLVAGELDVLPVVARTAGREPLVDFSLPHTETFDAFFRRTVDPVWPDLAAAAGKEIVVLHSDAAHHQLLERKFAGKLIPVESIPEGLRLVAAGKHDAFLCSKLIGVLEREQAGIGGVVAGPPIPDYKRVFCFAVRKGNTELREKLNQGLLLVKTDGTYDQIYRRWLVVEEPWQRWLPYFRWTVAGLVVLAGLVVALQALVRRRTRQLRELNATLEARINERTAALRESEQRLQLTLQASEVGTFEIDLRTGQGRWNAIMYGLLGLQAGDEPAVPETFFRFVHPEDVIDLRAHWEEATRTGKLDAEFRVIRADGQLRWLAGKGQFAFAETADEPGAPAKRLPVRFLGVNFDITARKQAEAALRASEERYRRLFDSMHEGFSIQELITDQQGRPCDYRFLNLNPAFERLTGIQPETALGKRALELIPNLEPVWIERYGQVALTGEPARFENYVAALGRWYEVFAYRNAPGQFAVIFADITARKQAEEQLQRFTAELQAANAELRQSRRAALNLMDDALAARQLAEQAAAALRASEERLALAREAAELGIHDFDVASGSIDWDCRLRQLWGIGPTEPVTYETFLAGLHPDDRETTDAALRRALDPASNGNLYVEYRMRNRRDGTEHHLAATGKVTFEQGRAVRLVGTVQDITRRKQAETAVRESEERYRRLFTGSRDALLLADAETGVLVDVNTQAERLLGRRRTELVRMHQSALHPPDEAQRYRELFQQHLSGGGLLEAEVLTRNGLRVAVEIAATLLEVNGRRMLLGVFRDITERKQAEAALRENEQRLQLALAVSRSFASEWNPATDQVFRSQSCAAILGISEEEATRDSGDNYLRRLHPDDRAWFETAFDQLTPGKPTFQTEYRLVRPDGGIVWLAETGCGLFDPHGKLQRVISTASDITARKQAETALQQHAKQLAEANKDLARFNDAMVGRELRMIELKKQINALRIAAGQPAQYPLDFDKP